MRYVVISISSEKIISNHRTLELARDARKKLRPHGDSTLMYEVYKYIE